MSKEWVPKETSSQVNLFLHRLVTSDGELIPINTNEQIVRIKALCPSIPSTEHWLVLLYERTAEELAGFLYPYGWFGLRIRAKDSGLCRAEAIATKPSLMRLPDLGLISNSVDYDRQDRVVHLKRSGKWFYAGMPNDVFGYLKTVMAVDQIQRRQGWGKFLIQVAAQVALAEGATRLEFGLQDDVTWEYSPTKISIYERALGANKVSEPGNWYIPINDKTPIDQIEAKI